MKLIYSPNAIMTSFPSIGDNVSVITDGYANLCYRIIAIEEHTEFRGFDEAIQRKTGAERIKYWIWDVEPIRCDDKLRWFYVWGTTIQVMDETQVKIPPVMAKLSLKSRMELLLER